MPMLLSLLIAPAHTTHTHIERERTQRERTQRERGRERDSRVLVHVTIICKMNTCRKSAMQIKNKK